MKNCKRKIPVKKTVVKKPFTIRTTKETREKFQKRAKCLGYPQWEFFELIVKDL